MAALEAAVNLAEKKMRSAAASSSSSSSHSKVNPAPHSDISIAHEQSLRALNTPITYEPERQKGKRNVFSSSCFNSDDVVVRRDRFPPQFPAIPLSKRNEPPYSSTTTTASRIISISIFRSLVLEWSCIETIASLCNSVSIYDPIMLSSRLDQVLVSHLRLWNNQCCSHSLRSLGWPKEAGVSNLVIPYFQGKVPVLGVCLGHECMTELYG